VYHKALKEAQPHWEAAKTAEEVAKESAQSIQDLEDKIKYLDAQILDFTPAEEQKAIKAQVKELKAEIKPLREQEREKWELAKDEQGKGDAIYWAVYNLDQKNPNSQSEFEHLPPEQLLADIAKKDQRVAELMTEIQAILQRNESGG
jgi:type I restriction enzyme M protein